MKLATWNVNSIVARLPLVLKWLEAAKPDVLCMQETKCIDEKFPGEAFAELGYVSQSFGQATYNGVAIVSRLKCDDVQRGFPGDGPDAHSRLLAATIGGIRVVNVYIPNGQAVGTEKYAFKLDWMRRLREFFDLHYNNSDQVLLCGDFNVAPEDRDVHDPRLWRGRIMCSDAERSTLSNVMQFGFVDAFRIHNAADKEFSWWDYRAGAFRRNLGLRIDHVWVSEPLVNRSRAALIDKATRAWERPSDHAPVIAEFE